MTRKKNKKKLVRARMAETGEAYQTAQRAVTEAVTEAADASERAPGAAFVIRFREHRFPLTEKPFTVGRETSCDLPLDDAHASRKHATFVVKDGHVRVDDHSQNGVFVNAKRIEGHAVLAHGDFVRIGQQQLTLLEGDKAPKPTPIGTTLAGRYKLLREVPIPKTKIGGEPESHAPWIFYEAKHVLLGGDVNIKLLPGALAVTEPHLRAWLLRQGRALQRIVHPQVVKVFDIGETDAEEVYLVLEQLSGITLAARLEDKGADEVFAREVVRQMAVILAHVHERGVVHRGLRNGVIHVDEQGSAITVKLSDFSFPTLSGDPVLTPAGAVFGNRAWMSPEQRRGEEVDGRSDIYTLGIILFTMIAGKLPEGGDDGSALPSPLAPICAKLLGKDPDARYANATALLEALR